MKIIIFSDTHLTSKFDKRKFLFLKQLIQSADKVIINGDFWDSWTTTFDRFIKSKWNQLFPLLLSKKTIYIFGNHDPETECDQRTNLFSVFSNRQYGITIFGHQYTFRHGHDLPKSSQPKYLYFYTQIVDYTNRKKIGKITRPLLNFIGNLGYYIGGTKLMTSSSLARKRNKSLKNAFSDDRWHIFGDTHCAELDIANFFANSGCIIHRHGSYLVIENNQVLLFQQQY